MHTVLTVGNQIKPANRTVYVSSNKFGLGDNQKIFCFVEDVSNNKERYINVNN